MGLKNIQLAGSLLSFFILAILVGYRNAPLYLPGAVYLVAAGYGNVISVVLVAGLRKKQRSGDPEAAAWAIQTKASLLTLSGWQVAIIGLLNVLQSGFSGSQASVIIGYFMTAIFAVVWFRLLLMADRSQQEGGPEPLSFFGRPRPRWMFFCLFFYTLIIPLIIASVELSNARWCPVLLRPPQFWLLLVSLMSAASTGLIFHRYWRAAPNKTWAIRVLIGTLLGIGLAGLVEAVWEYNLAIYLLSSVTVACVGASTYWLTLAKQVTSQLELGFAQ
jgi:hypothetical protein